MKGDGIAAVAHAAALCAGLVESGVEHLVFSPGSRSASIALAAEANPALRLWCQLDERSAGFFALGIAKATRRPVVLLCTSGTAAANFYPSVVEAKYGRVPLVILTADRPHELREVGAPQAIDQVGLFGKHVKAAFDLALAEQSAMMRRVARTTAARAGSMAAALPAGPVHLNVPFREPLFPAGGSQAIAAAAAGGTVQQTAPMAVEGLPLLSQEQLAAIAQRVQPGQRGLIVCGPQDDPALPAALSKLARALEFPVLADPLSGLRCGEHDRELVVDAYDAILRVGSWTDQVKPEVILRFGAMPTSRAYREYVEGARAPDAIHMVFDSGSAWHDPIYRATDMIHADPVDVCRRLEQLITSSKLGAQRGQKEPGIRSPWCRLWLAANFEARRALDKELATIGDPFEGSPFAVLAERVPEKAVLFVGNSMPIRDLDTFFAGRRTPLRILGNRGANGIDGLISTALGVGAGTSRPVVLVLGDLSFYHDLNGLLAAKQYGLNVTVLLLNNDGGGIFSFLPQAALEDQFEHLFGTPHGLDFTAVVQMYGGSFRRLTNADDVARLLPAAVDAGGLHVLELRTERQRNVVLHKQIWEAAEAAVTGVLRDTEVRR